MIFTKLKKWFGNLPIFSVIVSYLDKPKHRAIVLFPQMITWVITATILYLHTCFGFSLLPFTVPIHLISAGLLIVATIVILWSDFKRQKNINYNGMVLWVGFVFHKTCL